MPTAVAGPPGGQRAGRRADLPHRLSPAVAMQTKCGRSRGLSGPGHPQPRRRARRPDGGPKPRPGPVISARRPAGGPKPRPGPVRGEGNYGTRVAADLLAVCIAESERRPDGGPKPRLGPQPRLVLLRAGGRARAHTHTHTHTHTHISTSPSCLPSPSLPPVRLDSPYARTNEQTNASMRAAGAGGRAHAHAHAHARAPGGAPPPRRGSRRRCAARPPETTARSEARAGAGRRCGQGRRLQPWLDCKFARLVDSSIRLPRAKRGDAASASTRSFARTRARTDENALFCTRTHARTHARMRARAHSRVHGSVHARAHTQAHTPVSKT